MFRFVLRRLVFGIVLLFAITTLAFTLLYLGGGDIARRILGQNASQEAVDQRAAELGLDQPLFQQYTSWLGSALQGDLGRSWFTGQTVVNTISTRLNVTLTIVIGAILVTAVVAVALGVLASLRRGWVDRAVQLLSILGFAIPGFLIALGLVLWLAIDRGIFAATGYVPLAVDPAGWLKSVTLPITALTIGAIAAVTQQVRGSVIDAMQRDYVRTLRARGLSTGSVVFKHVLRNAGGPALAILAVQFVGMLGGAVIVEEIFAIPGLGQMAVAATSNGDIPIVMGLVLVTAVIVVIVNLGIDVLQAFLNPRVRLS